MMSEASVKSTTAKTSRVGRKAIMIPKGVDIKLTGNDLNIKGPKGQMHLSIHQYVSIDIENDVIKINPSKDKSLFTRTGSGAKLKKSIPGTVRAKIANAVLGVSKGFERKLVLVGVGYRAQTKGKMLSLAIGFSHPVEFHAPEGITIEAPSLTEIVVKGVDKHLVGHTASMIREVRAPEPYKGKGIRYADEMVVRKETKKK